MKDRIKAIRKSLKLTQQGFADKLGVKRNTVAQWEIGINNISEQVIRSICREFDINETWLRTGDGQMFQRNSGTIIDMLSVEYGLTEREREIISQFLSLDERDRASIIGYVNALVDKLSSEAADDLQNKNANPS